ncbi:hypothetical protein PTSG_03732 [Salpingoeca rosetta]|uniref:RNA polymerase II subunit B1 CTD phosphatase RPAP2 homolog n=1 Tax=Salpingoeca rosetta (strain ATCC 50818 / BSB-021) TaxID=946362 RepID=F2U6F1_SALR5|nr:uncharacterized protein PTSG_03732 [Salpingoeca rosetta]EGD83092.1 hypothetical protein PTSG_03732 [Salpingoeca rosetta]|eukprot:XP_004995456.1 hypothetical protein PTSG_03732 [Salpingoeca rosetta]
MASTTTPSGTASPQHRRVGDLLTRKEAERIRWDHVLKLCEDGVTLETLQAAANVLTKAHYDSAVEDRAISKRCGYPVCARALPQKRKALYKVHRNAGVLLDMQEANQFCSKRCFAASRHLRRQITGKPHLIDIVLPEPNKEDTQAAEQGVMAQPALTSSRHSGSGLADTTSPDHAISEHRTSAAPPAPPTGDGGAHNAVEGFDPDTFDEMADRMRAHLALAHLRRSGGSGSGGESNSMRRSGDDGGDGGDGGGGDDVEMSAEEQDMWRKHDEAMAMLAQMEKQQREQQQRASLDKLVTEQEAEEEVDTDGDEADKRIERKQGDKGNTEEMQQEGRGQDESESKAREDKGQDGDEEEYDSDDIPEEEEEEEEDKEAAEEDDKDDKEEAGSRREERGEANHAVVTSKGQSSAVAVDVGLAPDTLAFLHGHSQQQQQQQQQRPGPTRQEGVGSGRRMLEDGERDIGCDVIERLLPSVDSIAQLNRRRELFLELLQQRAAPLVSFLKLDTVAVADIFRRIVNHFLILADSFVLSKQEWPMVSLLIVCIAGHVDPRIRQRLAQRVNGQMLLERACVLLRTDKEQLQALLAHFRIHDYFVQLSKS